jgi:BirA family biotin operon repressor/biotin-[acetyl-CoA-carboxylase] ligase
MTHLLHVGEVDSTQNYLKAQFVGLAHGTVVQADCQTAGRGRFDRTWISHEGGLYFSVLLKPTKTDFLHNLTQLMALSVCRGLEMLGVHPNLKWPNDVQVDGRKICGILSETIFTADKLQAVIVGVGINIEQEGLTHVGQPATSLKYLHVNTDKIALLHTIMDFFWRDYNLLMTKGFESLRDDYIKRFPALGKEVTVRNGDKQICGTAEDISPRGTLLLKTPQGQEEIYIGDLMV